MQPERSSTYFSKACRSLAVKPGHSWIRRISFEILLMMKNGLIKVIVRWTSDSKGDDCALCCCEGCRNSFVPQKKLSLPPDKKEKRQNKLCATARLTEVSYLDRNSNNYDQIQERVYLLVTLSSSQISSRDKRLDSSVGCLNP